MSQLIEVLPGCRVRHDLIGGWKQVGSGVSVLVLHAVPNPVHSFATVREADEWMRLVAFEYDLLVSLEEEEDPATEEDLT